MNNSNNNTMNMNRQFSASTSNSYYSKANRQDEDDKMSYIDKRKTMMLNPMKTGDITFTEMRCIDKMKSMKKWEEAESKSISKFIIFFTDTYI